MQDLVGATLTWCVSQVWRPTPKTLNAAVLAHPNVVARYPGLAESLSKLECVLDASHMAVLASLAERIADLDASSDASAQWQISRLIEELERRMADLCARYDSLYSDEAFRTALWVHDDVMPEVRGHLESILHNHLLSH